MEPYSNNVLKRTVSTPKLYFYDSGIVCYLTRWSSPETAMEGAMSGALLENYTVAEIIKTYQNAGQEPFLYYYRDKDAREIDLILERDGKLFPIEIKKMASPPKKLTKVFDLIDEVPLRDAALVLSCAWLTSWALLKEQSDRAYLFDLTRNPAALPAAYNRKDRQTAFIGLPVLFSFRRKHLMIKRQISFLFEDPGFCIDVFCTIAETGCATTTGIPKAAVVQLLHRTGNENGSLIREDSHL